MSVAQLREAMYSQYGLHLSLPQMAQQQQLILPPAVLAALGITVQDVQGEEHDQINFFSDVMGYAAADSCRKALVGVQGTNLQMLSLVEDDDATMLVQVVLWVLKNKMKPTADEVYMLLMLTGETARRLGDGDMHAVNRRHDLTANGVLKPTGDDVVPDEIRYEWVKPEEQA